MQKACVTSSSPRAHGKKTCRLPNTVSLQHWEVVICAVPGSLSIRQPMPNAAHTFSPRCGEVSKCVVLLRSYLLSLLHLISLFNFFSIYIHTIHFGIFAAIKIMFNLLFILALLRVSISWRKTRSGFLPYDNHAALPLHALTNWEKHLRKKQKTWCSDSARCRSLSYGGTSFSAVWRGAPKFSLKTKFVPNAFLHSFHVKKPWPPVRQLSSIEALN